ncbi:ankyrin repeat domain-containing protein [Fusarium flagelliforme]|uniref:Ankyrin repeat domain-containing protein n=1 Tax=Fusarium flagelliforme TaxID=2675880 RepID=A0A395MC91_9HYPO|nr:ankyrin repeat domain-containing protein [Fusarium flagelliforme]
MSNPNDYTVGWICAITTEYVAAQEFLDEEHDGPEYVSPNDNNHYTLGRVGRHNVVIAVLPDNEYGKSSAAGVARDMMHSFPNVRIGLMVGIGGGAPGKHDIRLGDVVVSSGINNGGVLGYDFGKNRQGHDFQMTGFLNQPPTLLRAAMSGLKARYERRGHQISQAVDEILKNNKRLQKKYKQPEIATDQLFKSEVTHSSSCKTACRYDEANLVSRHERDEDEDYPVIHYGLIASADTLMKNALARDRLSEAHDILCFEMEAAGLMNHIPCLVVRGICDYSDSHKNKKWQGYAAMVAAAYAKDLLNQIAPNRVEAEMKISEILSGLHEVAKEHRDIAKEQLQAQRDMATERLSEEQQKCHQLFRLATGSRDATYEWYKDRVEDRVEDTCIWFLKHKNFQKWLNKDSGPLLVSADPGCGKSVLAKYLIDHGLPRSSTICYFFFKDQDQNTVRQALCALLHQLFCLKPCLIEHAMLQYHQNGQYLTKSEDSLWEILKNTVKDPRAGSIIIVLDALDECANSEFVDLMRNLQGQFRSDDPGFQNILDIFPNIHVPGEEESEAISQEVNCVIKRRIDQLTIERRLSSKIKSSLEQRLQNTSHRTYLWVYLVFDYLAQGSFKKTPSGIMSAIESLPKSVNEAYEQILNRSNEDPMVRKVLCIILAASRPLTISEMNAAVNVDDAVTSLDDLDLEDDLDFKKRLRSWCGLFISVHNGSIYFLHQTAREFLLADLQSPTGISSGLYWHHSITNSYAHDVLLNICLPYMNLFTSTAVLSSYPVKAENSPGFDRTAFMYYSAPNWATHFRGAEITDGATIIPVVRRLCDEDSAWFEVHSFVVNQDPDPPRCLTDLMMASYIGLPVIVKLLLEEGAGIEAKDSDWSRTSLSWAAEEGQEAVVKLLLEKGADVNTKSLFDETPVYLSAAKGYEAVVRLLLEKGADIHIAGFYGQTPLRVAAERGHEAVVGLLLARGADVHTKGGPADLTSLYVAALRGHEAIVRLLLEKGADANTRHPVYRKTPLHVAAERENHAIINLLLDNGAYIEQQDHRGLTPLCSAIRNNQGAAVKLLLEKGADIECIDSKCMPPLELAIWHKDIVRLLLDNGAIIDSRDKVV